MQKRYFILGCSFVFVMLIGQIHAIAQDNVVLGISQMVTLAVSNNAQFKKAGYQLENTKLEAKRMEAENWLNESTISDLQKRATLLNQQNQFQLEKDQLLVKVVDDYFRIKMAEKDIESKQKNTELEEIVLAGVKEQVAAGYSVDLDLLQQGNKYYNALFSFQRSELDYQQLQMEVKDRLGIDHDKRIVLSDMSIPDFPERSLRDSLDKALQNSFILQSHDIRIKIAERELKAAKANDLPDIEILRLENNLGIAKLDKSMSEEELAYQVETQWLNYNQAKNDILISRRNLRQMEENRDLIFRQVQAGLRNREDSLSADIGVVDAQSRLISSVRQVYQAYLELEKMMGTLNEGVLK